MTVPVGVPDAALTAAVNLTTCPVRDGFGEEDNEVVVGVTFTIWFSTADVLPPKPAEPVYAAVIVCEPGASDEVVTEAFPPDRVELAIVVEPL